jgi:hypothetical protein
MRRLTCAAALLLAGCSDPLGSGRVQMRAENDFYAVFRGDQTTTVRYTVTNGTDAPIEMLTCAASVDVTAERLDGRTWSPVVGLVCLPSPTPPIRIAAGETHTDSTQIVGWGTWRLRTEATQGKSSRVIVSRTFETGVPAD